MRKKYFPNKATAGGVTIASKKGMRRFMQPVVHDPNALPCRNLRDEFDLLVKGLYSRDASDELLRHLWQKAGTLLVKNPQADLEQIVHQVMADYLGPFTLGTA